MAARSATSAKKRIASPAKAELDKRVSRAEDLLQQLEEEILLGKLPPGSRLDEKQLADRFHVSRTPVREALWHLSSSGLIEMRRHHGAIVKQLTLVELVEMFQVMAEFEGFFESNNEFHECIFVGSKNNFLQQESRALRNRVNPYRRYITYQPGRM